MRVIMDEMLLIEEWQDVPKKAAQSLFNKVNMVRARVLWRIHRNGISAGTMRSRRRASGIP